MIKALFLFVVLTFSYSAMATDYFFNYAHQALTARDAAVPNGGSCGIGVEANGEIWFKRYSSASFCAGPDFWYGKCENVHFFLDGTCYGAPPSCPDVNGQTGIYQQDPGICEYDEPPPVTCNPTTEIAMHGVSGVESCVATSTTPCQNVTGTVNGQEICADNETQCAAAGGTHGYAGVGANWEEVCISNAVPHSDGSCPSSYQMTLLQPTDPAIDNYVQCQQPDEVPPTICDAALYDCDGDGNVDDQDGNGMVDNGERSNELACVGCVPGEPPDIFQNVGNDALETAATGAGQCDPTARNYAECIGLLSDSEEEEIDVGTRTDMSQFASGDEIAGDVWTRLGNAPITVAISSIAGIFSPSGGTCPTPSFTLFGQTYMVDYHCTLYSQIAGILSAVMLIIYSISGVRTIASA